MECQTNCRCGGKIFGALLIAAGLACGGFFPGYYYYQAKLKSNFVSVKGLAETDVRADLAVWDIKYVATGNELSATQQQINQNLVAVRNFLKEHGFQSEEIIEGRIETNDLMTNPYRDNTQNSVRFIVSQTVTVRSTKVDEVEKALRSTGDLVAKGVILDNGDGKTESEAGPEAEAEAIPFRASISAVLAARPVSGAMTARNTVAVVKKFPVILANTYSSPKWN